MNDIPTEMGKGDLTMSCKNKNDNKSTRYDIPPEKRYLIILSFNKRFTEIANLPLFFD
jgi:hypothetical protein